MVKQIEGSCGIMATFGGRLRQLREEKGLRQIELARLLNLESSSTISQYENEELNRIPDAHILQKLADIFNCTTDYILGRSIVRNPVETQASHMAEEVVLSDDDLEKIEEILAKVRARHKQQNNGE